MRKLSSQRLASGFLILWCVLLCLLAGCGDNDLELGTSDEEKPLQFGRGGSNLTLGAESGGGRSGSRPVEESTLDGNVFNLRPATLRPAVVFAFIDLIDSQGPDRFQNFRDAELGTLAEDRTFHIEHLAEGDLTIVFLLDEAGVNQDGTIDPGDPIAIFQDPAGLLRNLSANSRISLEDVDVTFNLDAPGTGTASVKTQANIIVTQGPHPGPSSEDPLP